jgi:hypothetical protein
MRRAARIVRTVCMRVQNLMHSETGQDLVEYALLVCLIALAAMAGAAHWPFFLYFRFRSRFLPDDFSFLLAGDTFAHGRLTNPTPAMWTHFETIHITMQPTYQSMYFPGRG